MVMLRHNIPLVSAELIGYQMGLVVPKDHLQYFWNMRTGPKPPAGYGTQASKKQYSPNVVFKKLNIPLKMTWSLINKFKNIDEFKKYLKDIPKKEQDVLVCYDWGKLFNQSDYQGGHVCVLDAVMLKENQVRIIDPSSDAPKWKIIDIDKLYEAMVYHGAEKSAGFWELKRVGPYPSASSK